LAWTVQNCGGRESDLPPALPDLFAVAGVAVAERALRAGADRARVEVILQRAAMQATRLLAPALG